MAAGLPWEGSLGDLPTAGSVARRDVPTCALGETLVEVRRRVRSAGWDTCVVVNESGVVLGLLRARELGTEDRARAEDAMRPGPSTYRPNVPIKEIAEVFTRRERLPNLPVTTSDGRLLGLLLREDAIRAAGGAAGGRGDLPSAP